MTANTPEFTVSELAQSLKRTVEDTYGHVRVRGELGRTTIAKSGHCYLDIKDDRAVINSIIWKGVMSRLSMRPEEGMEVICEGKLSTYPGLSNSRRITFEYVMLKGLNDQPWHAKQLIKLLRGIPCKVNLIPFNPWPGTDYECSDMETIKEFSDLINAAGYASPIRKTRGQDIFAACGQLKSDSEKKRASAIRKEAKA